MIIQDNLARVQRHLQYSVARAQRYEAALRSARSMLDEAMQRRKGHPVPSFGRQLAEEIERIDKALEEPQEDA